MVKIEKVTLWGWVLITMGCLFFVGYTFAAIVSKLLPSSTNPLISALQNDWYYCFLVPLTLPILVFSIYSHWLAMKLFKHA